jgi:hypothetical protein
MFEYVVVIDADTAEEAEDVICEITAAPGVVNWYRHDQYDEDNELTGAQDPSWKNL